MPELPEVYTIAKQLDKILRGKIIDLVEVLREKSMQGQTSQVVGKKVAGMDRKQKVMAIEFSGGELVILVHLKMTGQLIYVPVQETERVVGGSSTTALARHRLAGGHPTADWVGELPSKHTRVMIKFTDGSTLFFNDQRVFGWLKLVSIKEWEEIKKRMPPDVIDLEFTADYLYIVLQRSRRPVKLVVMDSGLIGGVGNIYANDALFLAGIDPSRPAIKVNKVEAGKLWEALVKVIHRGIETGGASMSHYVDTKGQGGSYQDEFVIYDKEGEECQKCGTPIVKIRLGGRGTYFCPVCQK